MTRRSERLDTLEMDRRVAGSERKLNTSTPLVPKGLVPALYERRDIDPTAEIFKRRHGSRRKTNVVPNLLGTTVNIDSGAIVVDRDFNSDISTTWTAMGTIRCPATTAVADSYFPLFQLNGCYVYIKHVYATNVLHLEVYRYNSGAGTLETSIQLGDQDTDGTDYRFLVARLSTSGRIRLNSWKVPAAGGTASISADTDADFDHDGGTGSFNDTENKLTFFGEPLTALSSSKYHGVILTNFLLYDATPFTYNGDTGGTDQEYETFAADTSPDKTISSPGAATLLYHEKFSEGGDILTYTNNGGDEILSYLAPTKPVDYATTGDPTHIHFGGGGTIEIPFYLDFDEYYWTTTNASARTEWCFAVKLVTPANLAESTVFEFQDLVRLRVFYDSGSSTYKLKAEFNNNTVSVSSTTNLAGATAYTVFVARTLANVFIKVVVDSTGALTEVSGGATNPIVYNYDKTLGFIIGDTVDLENTAPFKGKIERFSLHNESTRVLHPVTTAVLFYDVDSIYGDEVIDQGNRAINAFCGARSSSPPPFYREGAFLGGSYVAATGGYLISNSSPAIGYTGELVKPLTKDAVVQRRGKLSFLSSNENLYVIDDFSKTFRRMGIPRPSTKVSCTAQGVGPIDGFVRYAYRYVTQDGTVGPVFELDPCDARGGVDVFLGADVFGMPQESAFSLTYGECEGKNSDAADKGEVAQESVETFMFQDNDGTGDADPSLLNNEKALTLETAFRIPTLADFDESVISQGVSMPFGPTNWAADDGVTNFPWIGGQSQESTFQFTFRFQTGQTNQCLFAVGARNQHYETGLFNNDHYRLHHLVVSIQHASGASRTHSIVICRDSPSGSNHRDNDLHHYAHDYDFLDNNDYTIFVRRGGSDWSEPAGADLSIAIFNHTVDAAGGNGWAGGGWTGPTVTVAGFWGAGYSGSARDEVMWGACRREGSGSGALYGKTRVRPSNGAAFSFGWLAPFYNGTAADGTGGQRMYHGRMWRAAHDLTLLTEKALQRYGARSGPLEDKLEIDIAFGSDSSESELDGGWDQYNDTRTTYYSRTPSGTGATPADVVLAENNEQSVLLAYGFNNTITAASPDTHATTTTDKVPLWASYISRNEGSLAVGVGGEPVLEVANRKWHDGSGVLTFDDFGQAIDLKQWTWLTLYFRHITRVGATTFLDVWLERVFIDGNTGDWGEFFNADTSSDGPEGLYRNAAAGSGQHVLYTVGGMPGIDSQFEVEIAEVRLWAGERYTAEGGGDGAYTFGPYISTRIPPNDWDKLWHYGRFVLADVDNETTPTTMDQFGTYSVPGTTATQTSADAIKVYQGATIKQGDDNLTTGSDYFVPFPQPPLSAIRGIQIFRTQVIPVVDEFVNGNFNPNAEIDAFRAARAAPLYFLTEIPKGTEFYFDTANDGALGAALDAAEGLIPAEPMGIFEWGGYLGVWVKDRPRIYFSATPSSWESFPFDRIVDIPVRESGRVQAATELASRDARQSRVLVLGESWGVFLDGSPTTVQTNSLGGGVGASSSRCLVVEKGIAYAYNGTLWAITGDGQVEDIGLPVLDLLPPTANTRLSVSSILGSLFVIDETTGLALRFHFARREWFVEDRYALSVTDIDGVDSWAHISGYPSEGHATTYGDDVESNTAAAGYTVSSFDNAANTFTVGDSTGLKIGQRVTLVATANAMEKQTVVITGIASKVITTTDDLNLTATGPDISGATVTYSYKGYVGVGNWGTMLDTGQFNVRGTLEHVDLGITDGDGWYATFDASDFAKDPSDRSGFDASESVPAHIVNDSGSGTSSRWGLTNKQRLQRLLIWSPLGGSAGLSEVELTYTSGK